MDATELGRWSRFAAKGGIGKCTALQDYVAEEPEDLMFMKDDEITVLLQLADEDVFLGYCEGVIGRFRGSFVRFHSRLKKPVMTKRSSSGHSISPSHRPRSRSQSRPSSSQSAVTLAARDVVSPPVPFQASPAASRASSPRMSLSVSGSSSIMTEMDSMGSTGSVAKFRPSSSISSVRALEPLSKVRSMEEGPHPPERSTSYSSSRSATLETAPPTTPATLSPDEEEYTVRIAVHSRDHPEQLSPVVRESVLFGDEEEGSGQALTPGPMTSPLNIRKSPSATSPQPPPSPIRSDISSDISPRSFSFDVDGTEDSSRLSLDMSAGVEGIGLSLLQGFLSGGANGDDDASILSSRSGANTPHRDDAADDRQSVASTVNIDGRLADSPRSATQSVSHYSRSPSPSVPAPASPTSPLPSPHEFDPPNPPYARHSQRSSMHSLKSMRSLQSLRPSLAGSENSGGSGSGWEGDIYDDYRYSRFSMASKMSRLSQGSIKPTGDIPPVPSDHLASRLNMESSVRVSEELDRGAQLPAAVVVSSESGTITSELPTAEEAQTSERGATLKDKDRPSPLSLQDRDTGHNNLRYSSTSTGEGPSPLLHASFGSPTQSATPRTPASPNTPASVDSFVSPPPGSPGRDVFSGLSPPRDVDVRRVSGQAIVVEDDEEPPFMNGPASPTSPRDQSAFASTKAREAAERAMSPSNEPAPPPYAISGPSRPMQYALSPPPQQGPPLLRTRSTNQPPVDPASRQSLFMPHPHAPKPAQVPAGPMYGRQPAPFQPPQQYNGPPPNSAIQIIHTLLSQQQQGRRPGGASTIYARFDRDLITSTGPVPISFTLEPQMNIPANRPVMYNHGPGSRAGSPAAGISRVGTPLDPSPYDVAATMAQGSSLARSATASPGVAGLVRTASSGVGSNLARSATASPKPVNSPPQVQGEFGRPDSVSSGKAIPRPNFFPKSGTPRPRSRSFSGFDSPIAEVVMPEGNR
ncbi:uncharacterized protein B0H18DRAFT_105443 [Fomitopsis serialis]|uniref:uncharacterized protein n=1 Tax=Fomitopsis serialis TaxID=139415 RepID=UPI002008B90C|nr:uncharacterized protein B0H18DRAFT_105443 [Neoantrodia serialis]KAH9931375.1 hypothetical protein B0H18DRAFT_105443 [Neoantrodia serialis]